LQTPNILLAAFARDFFLGFTDAKQPKESYFTIRVGKNSDWRFRLAVSHAKGAMEYVGMPGHDARTCRMEMDPLGQEYLEKIQSDLQCCGL